MVQGHETVNLGGQQVTGQGHRRPKLDLEAWRWHHSRPLILNDKICFNCYCRSGHLRDDVIAFLTGVV